MKATVFYSWQQDHERKYNGNLIENCLKAAIQEMRRDSSLQLDLCLDRDTKGEPGSPDIIGTILAKIGRASAFVADVTLMPAPDGTKRKSPNPNVLVELGYAMCHLGSDRVVLVCNTAHGAVEELPFDIRHRRMVKYVATQDTNLQECKKLLKGLLRSRLSEIPMAPQDDGPHIVVSGGSSSVKVERPPAAANPKDMNAVARHIIALPLEPLGSASSTLDDVDCVLTFPKGMKPFDLSGLERQWSLEKDPSQAIERMFSPPKAIGENIGEIFDFIGFRDGIQTPVSRQTSPFESPAKCSIEVKDQRVRFHIKRLKKNLYQPLPDIFVRMDDKSVLPMKLPYIISTKDDTVDGNILLEESKPDEGNTP